MPSLANPRFLAHCPLPFHSFSTGGWATIEWTARNEHTRDRRSENVKTGYPLDAFNPVIIETTSFLSVSFV
jgi:hypothetical protein